MIEPNGSGTLVVTTTLRESGIHNAVLRVEMQESLNFVDVKMTVRGIGTSLEFKPELQWQDLIDFGTIFT